MTDALSQVATTRLYRAVSSAECDRATRNGESAITGSSVEGKYFAETFDHTVQWGDRLFGKASYRIVAITLPSLLVEQFYRFGHLDGIGPALFAAIEDLRGIVLESQEVR
jgi:hypothetical protein